MLVIMFETLQLHRFQVDYHVPKYDNEEYFQMNLENMISIQNRRISN
jgi:single-stranded DNA-specific DHH superfamily exonuclease